VAHPNEVLLRESFAALGRGDLDTVRSQYWAENIRWHIPSRSPLAADYDGAAQILGFIGRVFELSGSTFSSELRDVLANDERAVALYTERAEREGKRWVSNTVTVFHIRDGKITEIWSYLNDQYGFDEFWS
jgi:ketosteroid isomerase-like protein